MLTLLLWMLSRADTGSSFLSAPSPRPGSLPARGPPLALIGWLQKQKQRNSSHSLLVNLDNPTIAGCCFSSRLLLFSGARSLPMVGGMEPTKRSGILQSVFSLTKRLSPFLLAFADTRKPLLLTFLPRNLAFTVLWEALQTGPTGKNRNIH